MLRMLFQSMPRSCFRSPHWFILITHFQKQQCQHKQVNECRNLVCMHDRAQGQSALSSFYSVYFSAVTIVTVLVPFDPMQYIKDVAN